MFLRLIDRANWIIDEGRSGLFDVIAENVCDGFSLGKANHPFGACLKSGEVLHEQPPWIQAVSCEENGSIAVIDRDAHGVVTGDWNYVQNAASEVNLADVIRPVLNTVKFFRCLKLRGNNHDRQSAPASVSASGASQQQMDSRRHVSDRSCRTIAGLSGLAHNTD